MLFVEKTTLCPFAKYLAYIIVVELPTTVGAAEVETFNLLSAVRVMVEALIPAESWAVKFEKSTLSPTVPFVILKFSI